MRFLLDDSNATYANGVWTFTLDHSLSNASRMQIRKAVYVASTDQTAPPHVVYVRSDALHRLSKRKHTNLLKENNHEDSSNVVCVLEEQHDKGRYRLHSPGMLLPLVWTPLRTIDLYFTRPGGQQCYVLDGHQFYGLPGSDRRYGASFRHGKNGRNFQSI